MGARRGARLFRPRPRPRPLTLGSGPTREGGGRERESREQAQRARISYDAASAAAALAAAGRGAIAAPAVVAAGAPVRPRRRRSAVVARRRRVLHDGAGVGAPRPVRTDARSAGRALECAEVLDACPHAILARDGFVLVVLLVGKVRRAAVRRSDACASRRQGEVLAGCIGEPRACREDRAIMTLFIA